MFLKPVQISCETMRGSGPEGAFYQGDVLQLLDDLKEKYPLAVKLIYLDPPFMTGETFEMRVRVGEKEWRNAHGTLALESFTDYKDKEAYMDMMRRVLTVCREMLTDDGMIFLHIDYRAHARLRLLMDELFGEDNFLNEIIWTYQTGGRARKFFSRKHDVILFYRKTKNYDFNMEAVMEPRTQPRTSHMRRHIDPDGRVYRSIRSGGRVYTYYDDDPVAPGDVWDDISHLQQKDPQRTGYDTQKPLKLLERIVKCASREGDLVMDLFAGSSTTLEAAAANGRRYLGADSCHLAPGIARRRLQDTKLTLHLKPGKTDAACSVSVTDGVGLYRVELESFEAPNLTDREFAGMDMIDSWAVGYLEEGVFRAMAQSIRSHKNPKLSPVLQAPVYEGRLAVRVSDVYGRSYYFVCDDDAAESAD